ncbi:hypothetical protein TWF191_005913 [Orbilia oligospora]|uniref:gamma-glutamylcyclotransferase n=1 Tax=Orbilia oligospora TaxID=2813651 RepID=A0A7C8QTP4_ORBOL|nr:hypothetical protein TWF191_005913 [Orbilia oligospora]
MPILKFLILKPQNLATRDNYSCAAIHGPNSIRITNTSSLCNKSRHYQLFVAMASIISRVLFGRRDNASGQTPDPAKVAEPVTTFPSPNFKESVKYLAYGSNLSAETFLGRRGIKPLSQVKVRVPSLTLSFDLAGIPYKEPRFANVRPREEEDQELMGVVYEVTPEDYRTILTTEGGYSVIEVTCIPLEPVKGMDSFESKTLIGARQHSLPTQYQDYIANTGYYEARTIRQKVGSVAVLLTVLPVVIFLFGIRNFVSDKDGKAPKWLNDAQVFCFGQIWNLYDYVWKPLYGDGESTRHSVKKADEVVANAGPATETDALLVKAEEVTAVNWREPENSQA